MFNEILDSCKYVVDNANDVKIDYASIDNLIKNMDYINHSHWLQSSPFGILDFDTKDIVSFLILYHSVGFSYWGNPKWTIETENGQLDGAYAMMFLLINEMKNNPDFLNPTFLQSLSKDDLKRILKGNVEIPLLEERYSNIISISKSINNNMNGDFYGFIKDVTSDTELFKIIISNFNVFNDISNYKEKKVQFYKLAQLLVSDLLHIREIKEKIPVDYSHLLGCADYKIPQVMRGLGILEYSSKLAGLIDNQQEILKDSSYEVEIRASMLVAINIINEKSGARFCPIEINDCIWLNGQDKLKKLLPYHLTRTTFY